MTALDGRITAWLNAQECLTAATKAVWPKHLNGRLTADESAWRWHWSLMAQANQWCLLAQAPADVGIAAGTHLAEEQERRAKLRGREQEAFAEVSEARRGTDEDEQT